MTLLDNLLFLFSIPSKIGQPERIPMLILIS